LGLGGGGWGLGVGGWGPNPQPPIPNPQSPIPIKIPHKAISISFDILFKFL